MGRKDVYSLVQLILVVMLRRRLQLVQRHVELVYSRVFAGHAASRVARVPRDRTAQ